MGKKALATGRTQALLSQYDAIYQSLNLKVEADTTFIRGNASMLLKSKVAGLDTLAIELHNRFGIDSVCTKEGLKLNYERAEHALYIVPSQLLEKDSFFEFVVYYKGLPPDDASAAIGNGFSSERSPTYGTRVTWSLSQPYAALEWWPCKQALDDKIDSVDLNITTSVQNKVGSNGTLTGITVLSTSQHTYHWKSRYPIAYYLVSIAVGPYIEIRQAAKVSGINDSIPVIHYLYNNRAYTNNKSAIDATVPLL